METQILVIEVACKNKILASVKLIHMHRNYIYIAIENGYIASYLLQIGLESSRHHSLNDLA